MPDWEPTADLETLRARATILECIRAFFREREMLEVETPHLSPAAVTDPHIASVRAAPQDGLRYLHTSPEYAMKRLLAAGSGPIWQLCKVFRDGESGSRHNPEFTLLEWYRPGWSMDELMDEVETLARTLIPDLPSAERLTYRQAFRETVRIDPLTCSTEDIRVTAQALGSPELGEDTDAWRDFLLTHAIEPRLPAFCFLQDFPASQAALARIRPGSEPPVAERFELYLRGMELANGYRELTDPKELRRRFTADNACRRKWGLPEMPPDERLLAAMEHGLPECAGVALGLDRLVMQALGLERIEKVLTFSWNRA